jgi:hypothetical protein
MSNVVIWLTCWARRSGAGYADSFEAAEAFLRKSPGALRVDLFGTPAVRPHRNGESTMQSDGYPPSKFDPFDSGVPLGALGWAGMLPSLMLPTFTTPSQARDGFARLEAATDDATSQPAIVSTAPRRQRLRRFLDRLRRRRAAIEIAQASPLMKEQPTMKDSDFNPMKTGLMFVAPGWASMSPGCIVTPSHCLDRLARLQAAVDRGAHAPWVVSAPKRERAFRRLLERLAHLGRRRQPSTT